MISVTQLSKRKKKKLKKEKGGIATGSESSKVSITYQYKKNIKYISDQELDEEIVGYYFLF